MVRITHFRYKCIGCAYCEEIAPYRWKMNEQDGKSDLLDSKFVRPQVQMVVVDDFEYEDNEQIAQLCPANCIKVEKF